MFDAIKAKLRDANTIRHLCEFAEAHALRDQQAKPGAEHFLLAALDLDDGTATQAFERVGADPADLKPAIECQYAAALQSIGIALPGSDGEEKSPRRPQPGVYNAAPSGQEVIQELATTRDRHAPLLGAHVVAIVAAMPHGVASRALRELGVDATRLRTVADEISAGRQSS